MNKFSYVQGNPIRLTDPFGLCPDISLTRIGHAALDLLGIILGLDVCDGIKAGSRIIGNAGELIQSGSQAVESAGNLYDSYVKDGEVISWKNATDLITLGLSVAGMGMAGKSLARDGKALKALSEGNVNVKPAAVSNSTGSSGTDGADLQKLGKKSGKSSNLVAYYEYKALKQQGYNASEAYELMKQFRSGSNPNNGFAFHFTTLKGGKCITDTRGIYGSKSGVWGKGVYAGTTPTPSWALKHIPYSGWGLGNTPVRIPIKLNANMNIVKPIIPVKTILIKTKYLNFSGGN